jgi:hypothetical protein
MPLYFIDVLDDAGLTADNEGIERANADAAIAEAVKGVRSLLASQIEKGWLNLNGLAILSDVNRQVLQTIRYGDVVDIVHLGNTLECARNTKGWC